MSHELLNANNAGAPLNDLYGCPSDLQKAPGDQTARETEEGFVHVGALLVPHAKSAKLIEPGEGSFDNPAPFPQSTAVFCISLCQESPGAPGKRQLGVSLLCWNKIKLA